MRNRRKTILRDHAVLEVTLRLAQGTIESQLCLRPSLFEDLKGLPLQTIEPEYREFFKLLMDKAKMYRYMDLKWHTVQAFEL